MERQQTCWAVLWKDYQCQVPYWHICSRFHIQYFWGEKLVPAMMLGDYLYIYIHIYNHFCRRCLPSKQHNLGDWTSKTMQRSKCSPKTHRFVHANASSSIRGVPTDPAVPQCQHSGPPSLSSPRCGVCRVGSVERSCNLPWKRPAMEGRRKEGSNSDKT